MKIVYDKAKGDSAAEDQNGRFGIQMAPTDLSGKDYLSFWVYNKGEPLTLRVRLEDTTGGSLGDDGGTGPADADGGGGLGEPGGGPDAGVRRRAGST